MVNSINDNINYQTRNDTEVLKCIRHIIRRLVTTSEENFLIHMDELNLAIFALETNEKYYISLFKTDRNKLIKELTDYIESRMVLT